MLWYSLQALGVPLPDGSVGKKDAKEDAVGQLNKACLR